MMKSIRAIDTDLAWQKKMFDETYLQTRQHTPEQLGDLWLDFLSSLQPLMDERGDTVRAVAEKRRAINERLAS